MDQRRGLAGPSVVPGSAVVAACQSAVGTADEEAVPGLKPWARQGAALRGQAGPGGTGTSQRWPSCCTALATRWLLPGTSLRALSQTPGGLWRLSTAHISPVLPRFGRHSNRTVPKCNLGGGAGNPTASGGPQESLESSGRTLGGLQHTRARADSLVLPRGPGRQRATPGAPQTSRDQADSHAPCSCGGTWGAEPRRAEASARAGQGQDARPPSEAGRQGSASASPAPPAAPQRRGKRTLSCTFVGRMRAVLPARLL